jgi:hypothetical protein
MGLLGKQKTLLLVDGAENVSMGASEGGVRSHGWPMAVSHLVSGIG